MANIASAKSKLNDIEVAESAALSEALHTKLGANINYLIDQEFAYKNVTLKSQTFTSNGNFTVPAGVTKVLVFGCGGGAGGGGGGQGGGPLLYGATAGTGGGGAGLASQVVAVTPLAVMPVTLGAGGGGGGAGNFDGAGFNGGDGTSSLFDTYEFKGARHGWGGVGNSNLGAATGRGAVIVAGVPSGNSYIDVAYAYPVSGGGIGSQRGSNGGDSAFATGGVAVSSVGGGGGGGGASGAGGAGGAPNGAGSAATGYGCGGGGGGTAGAGGAGSPGLIIVAWVSE